MVTILREQMDLERSIQIMTEAPQWQEPNYTLYNNTLQGLGKNITKKIFDDHPSKNYALLTILRAGLHFGIGGQQVLSASPMSYMDVKRVPHEGGFFFPVNYQALTDLKGKDLIIYDPAHATGGSANAVIDRLWEHEEKRPNKIIFASMVTVQEGIDALSRDYDFVHHYTIWKSDRLDQRGYIQDPACGDVGDLSSGQLYKPTE